MTESETPARRAPYALPWHKVDYLGPMQVAGMQSVDDARREGTLSEAEAGELFAMVRAGRVDGVRKRLTEARRKLTAPTNWRAAPSAPNENGPPHDSAEAR